MEMNYTFVADRLISNINAHEVSKLLVILRLDDLNQWSALIFIFSFISKFNIIDF